MSKQIQIEKPKKEKIVKEITVEKVVAPVKKEKPEKVVKTTAPIVKKGNTKPRGIKYTPIDRLQVKHRRTNTVSIAHYQR